MISDTWDCVVEEEAHHPAHKHGGTQQDHQHLIRLRVTWRKKQFITYRTLNAWLNTLSTESCDNVAVSDF